MVTGYAMLLSSGIIALLTVHRTISPVEAEKAISSDVREAGFIFGRDRGARCEG